MEEIRKTIQALGMTEQGLAADIGVSSTTINRLLARTPKSIVILQKIRQHLEAKTGESLDLLGYPETKENESKKEFL